jgi:hypothetical protein
MMDSFHTAQYQYFPALTSAHGPQLALTLNAPPSFQDPKSVLVVALPAIEPPQFPPLRGALALRSGNWLMGYLLDEKQTSDMRPAWRWRGRRRPKPVRAGLANVWR